MSNWSGRVQDIKARIETIEKHLEAKMEERRVLEGVEKHADKSSDLHKSQQIEIENLSKEMQNLENSKRKYQEQLDQLMRDQESGC